MLDFVKQGSNADEASLIEGEVLSLLLEWQRQGLKTALVTIAAVDGRSPYPVGTHLGVCEDGRYCGYLTSGCAELAIVNQTINHINFGQRSIERYGKDSPYFDITLPCGSGIDVLIDPFISLGQLEQLVTALNNRKSASLITSLDNKSNQIVIDDTNKSTGISKQSFYRYYPARPKLVIVGQGPIVKALSKLAVATKMEIDVFVDNHENNQQDNGEKLNNYNLSNLSNEYWQSIDDRTAFITLFHDHDKEIPLLEKALKLPFFYIGALGSQTTHYTRIEQLKMMGISDQLLDKIHGPVGQPIAAKTPEQIAISIIAEIIAKLNQA